MVGPRKDRPVLLTVLHHSPPSPVGSANDVAVSSPDVTRCHGMSQGDRERSRQCRKNVARCRKNVEMS